MDRKEENNFNICVAIAIIIIMALLIYILLIHQPEREPLPEGYNPDEVIEYPYMLEYEEWKDVLERIEHLEELHEDTKKN